MEYQEIESKASVRLVYISNIDNGFDRAKNVDSKINIRKDTTLYVAIKAKHTTSPKCSLINIDKVTYTYIGDYDGKLYTENIESYNSAYNLMGLVLSKEILNSYGDTVILQIIRRADKNIKVNSKITIHYTFGLDKFELDFMLISKG